MTNLQAPTLINLRRENYLRRDPRYVYIGRPSQWGNPFMIGIDGTREQVIALYERYVTKQSKLMADLPLLSGKILVCWCVPFPCHGHVLIKLFNRYVLCATS